MSDDLRDYTAKLHDTCVAAINERDNAIRQLSEWSAKCGAAEKERDDAIAAVRKLRAALRSKSRCVNCAGTGNVQDGSHPDSFRIVACSRCDHGIDRAASIALADTAKYEEVPPAAEGASMSMSKANIVAGLRGFQKRMTMDQMPKSAELIGKLADAVEALPEPPDPKSLEARVDAYLDKVLPEPTPIDGPWESRGVNVINGQQWIELQVTQRTTNKDTNETIAEKVAAMLNRAEKPPTMSETIDAAYEAGGKAWDDVEDPDKFLREIRGDCPPASPTAREREMWEIISWLIPLADEHEHTAIVQGGACHACASVGAAEEFVETHRHEFEETTR